MSDQDAQYGQRRQGTVVTVKQAAQQLGVSERTIYRHLKSGKLTPYTVSKSSVIADSMSVAVKHFEKENGIVTTGQNMSESVKMLIGTVSEETLRHALDTLGKRDAEIARMIEYQQELTQTIARLQDQMFELTRLVIAMNLERGETPDLERSAQQKDGKPEETSENMIRRWIESLKARIAHR